MKIQNYRSFIDQIEVWGLGDDILIIIGREPSKWPEDEIVERNEKVKLEREDRFERTVHHWL